MKTRQDKIRKPIRNYNEVPEYSWGGVAANMASGAAVGAIGGGGVLSLPGALIGGGAGLITGLFDHFKEKKEEKIANMQASRNSAAASLSAGGSTNNFLNQWVASYGGVTPNGTDVSLEKNEVTWDMGNDSMMKFNLPPHPNKSRIPLKPGTIVFSDNPKLRMPDGKLPAEAADEIKKQKAAFSKVLENRASTKLARKTAEQNIFNADKQLGKILAFQLEKTAALGEKNKTKSGNVEEASLGTIIKGAGKFLTSDAGQSLVSNLGALAPVGYNLFRSGQKAEVLNPAAFQNPMAYNALQTMTGRRPNVTPALQDVDTMTAGADANLRSTATGRGQYMTNRIALANQGMTSKAGIRSQGQNQYQQYLGELGQMQAGLGQRMADTNLMVSDLNARNQAAQRSFGAAAVGQLGQYTQVQQQMRNQAGRDKQLLSLYNSWMDNFKTGMRDPAAGPSRVATSMPSVAPALAGIQPFNGVINGGFDYTPDPAYEWQMQGR